MIDKGTRIAFFVALDNDGVNDIFTTASSMNDGNLYLIVAEVQSGTFLNQTGSILLDFENAGGLDMFNNAAEALITDSDNDQVIRVNLSTENQTEIEVGDNPLGVVVNFDGSLAYVVNAEDRTITTIDLSDNSTSTSDAILGLSPTEIVVDPNGDNSEVGVLNTGDESVTVIDESEL